jgi:hypothetical protein
MQFKNIRQLQTIYLNKRAEQKRRHQELAGRG